MPLRALSPTGPFYRESTPIQRSRPPIRVVGPVSSDRFEMSKPQPCFAGLPDEIKLQIIGELGVISPRLLDTLAAVSLDFRNLTIEHAIHTLERETTEWERQKLKSMTGEEVGPMLEQIDRSLLVVEWLIDPRSARLRSAKEQNAKQNIIWKRKSKFQAIWSAIASFLSQINYFISGLFGKTKVEADTLTNVSYNVGNICDHHSSFNFTKQHHSRIKCVTAKLSLMTRSLEQQFLKE